jgi:outer membrane usher protein
MRWRGLSNGIWALLLVAFSLQAQADFHRDVLLIELRFNGQQFGDAYVLTDDDGDYYVEEFWLRRWEVVTPLPEARHYSGKSYYAIGDFPGATARLISQEMILDITMPPDLLPLRVVDMRGNYRLAPTANFGAYMDYDWNYRRQASAGLQTFSGLIRPVMFGQQGNVLANLLYRKVSGDSATQFDRQTNGLNVLDLTYTRDDPNNLRSLRVGDVITASGSLGRSLRLGGIQFATNFATQPTLITYPLPSFYGQAAVPTALDIYVNGQLSRREDVAPGNYILEDIPVVNGAGQMRIVTEDALGRQQLFVQDFYVSTELLREGLNEYSFNLGALRDAYGLENFQYGDIAGSATWRHGLVDHLTIEGHLEFTDDLGVLAAAGQYQPTSGGILSTGLGISSGSAGTGGQWLVGYQQADSFFSYNIRLTGVTSKFALVGITEPLPALQFFASGGFNAPIRGSIGAAITHQEFRDRADRSIVSVNYSTSFSNRLSLSAVASYINAEEDDYTFGIRFSVPFGAEHTVSGGVSARRESTQLQLEARRSLPVGPGYGYHLSLNSTDSTYVNAGAIAQNEFGTVSAALRSSAAGSEWQVGSSGSVASLGGMTRVTRQIRDAFAVVNVGDYEGVRVYAENQVVGRTDKNGQLFIPGLRPYQRNQIAIEVADLPLSARIGNLKSETSPYLRSGVIVQFDVMEARDAIIQVVLPDGTPVRQGAVARVWGHEKWSPIGTDGRLYLHGLEQPSQVTVRWNGSICDFIVPKPGGTDVIPNLGEFICEPREFQ